jgi:mono/diheme cytochrome c family protein
MRDHLKLIVIATCLVVPGVLLACGSQAAVSSTVNVASANATPSPTTSPTPSTDTVVGSRELYKTNCAQCHKDDGKGGESVVDGKKINAKDLTGDRMKTRSDAKLYDDIAEGSEDDGMPAFRAKLTDAQIKDVVKYIRAEIQHAK